jgi:hypothetical protein
VVVESSSDTRLSGSGAAVARIEVRKKRQGRQVWGWFFAALAFLFVLWLVFNFTFR